MRGSTAWAGGAPAPAELGAAVAATVVDEKEEEEEEEPVVLAGLGLLHRHLG